MRRSDPRFDLNMTDHQYCRRLGLIRRTSEDKITFNRKPEGNAGVKFPNSLEEAAYLLVGLEWKAYQEDYEVGFAATEKKFLGNLRLELFRGRHGTDVYDQLVADLGTEVLPDLSLPALFRWSKTEKNQFLLRLIPQDFRNQFEEVVNCLEGKPGNIRCLDTDRAWHGVIEKETGHRRDSVRFDPKTLSYSPEDPNRGKKGTEHNRIRIEIRMLAKTHIRLNPNSRPRDFLNGGACREFLNALPPKNRPGDITIKRWISNLGYSKRAGRPRG
jgi:hypothetical protein